MDSADAVPSDAELITAVRAGDDDAFATLWRRHEAAALRLARQITNPSNAEDLVSESFARLLRVLRQGGGPDGAFRPYLFSTLRRLNIDNARSYGQRISLTDDDNALEGEPSSSAADVAALNAENSAAWRAWASLPESSRTLLWHLVVEEETPAQVAPLVGTSANGVSSRAVRARERLRQAFLQQHVAEAADEDCRWARARMGEYVRDALSARDRTAVQAHLDECDKCRAVLFEITDVNQTLRLVIAPVVLGGVPAATYTGITHTAVAGGAARVLGATHGRGLWSGLSSGRRAAVSAGGVLVAATIGVATAFGLQSSPSSSAVASQMTTNVGRTVPAAAPSSTAAPVEASATPATTAPAAPPSVITRSTAGGLTKVTPKPTPRPKVLAPTTPVVTPTSPAPAPSTSVTVPPPPPPPPVQTTLTGQPHFVLFGSSADPASVGTVDLTVPTGWTINAVHVTAPTTGWTCASTTSTVHCDIAVPDASTEYDYTLDLTGPADDHTSTETITYADGAFTTTITPLVNP